MSGQRVTPDQAKQILDELREEHLAENWMKPSAPSWDECHVQDTTGKTLAQFEQELKAEGYGSFEEFFIASLVNPGTAL